MADEGMKKVEALKKTYLRVFSSADGKKVLEDMEGSFYINAPTISNSNDPLRMALHEGMRNAFLHIKHMMNLDIELIAKLRKEQDDA